MNTDFSLRALEWERLVSYLVNYAQTAWGRELCSKLDPFSPLGDIETSLDEAQEGLWLLEAGSNFNLDGLPELRQTLARLEVDAELNAKEFLALKQALDLVKSTRASLSLIDNQSFPQLTKLIRNLHSLEPLNRAIADVIDEAGLVRNTASPLLNSLRRDVQRLDSQIRDELMSIIHSSTLSKALQEPIYTERQGRYVLPVNSSNRQVISGIVHDSSASGLTIYVEPMAVVELANKIRLRESEIEREIQRILAELSLLAKEKILEITSSNRSLIELDFIMARARLALAYGGQKPELSIDGSILFKDAKHPLLVLQKKGQVIPNTIVLNKNKRTLILTGPNTGGKTVVLKLVGLLSLMLKAGLLLPVKSDSRAVVFKQVIADIGDEQSLEQSLSTFSSHMSHIVNITQNANPSSLVLLDEIGAGTDPHEGAALARSILEHLDSVGAYTVTSTHYGELKTLALAEESGFENASLEFDEDNLSPSYKLRLGVPGSSKALTIARRLGLSDAIIVRAEANLSKQGLDLQKAVERLDAQVSQLALKEAELANALEEARRQDQEARRLQEEIAQREMNFQTELASKLEEEFVSAQESVRAIIRQAQKEPSSQKAQKAKQELEKLRGDLKWLSSDNISRGFGKDKTGRHKLSGALGRGSGAGFGKQAGGAGKESDADDFRLIAGAYVKILSLGQIAVVEEVPEDIATNAKALITVKAGNLKMQVKAKDLVPCEPPAKSIFTKMQKARNRTKNVGTSSRAEYTNPEPSSLREFVATGANTLDLRGKRYDEAHELLQVFLDQGFVDRLFGVMIIHGHGTGALKAMTRDYLSGLGKSVKYRSGQPYEGGDGVTVVEFVG